MNARCPANLVKGAYTRPDPIARQIGGAYDLMSGRG